MRICIFSGTSEGHELCQYLSAHHIAARGVVIEAYVATDYGADLLEPAEGITIHSGRLSFQEILLEIDADTLVIDATHPYATVITEHLRNACQQTSAEYIRLVRPAGRTEASGTGLEEGVVMVPDTAAAVQWLQTHPGKALLTTGSKELEAYTAVDHYWERFFVRVLPAVEALQKCEALGFSGSHVIAMQGPFPHALNAALLRQTGAEILVTKDTGDRGGFREKLSAARETGALLLTIARPVRENGFTLEEVETYLAERLKLAFRFPLFVPLTGRKCIIFGAGNIAARRAEVLRRFGAEVQIIAPASRSALRPDENRTYRESDLAGAFLAIAATDDRLVNSRIAKDCRKHHIFCSVADNATESTFFFPAVCEGNDVIAGVVSGGKAHRKTAEAAKRIRAVLQELDKNLDEDTQ